MVERYRVTWPVELEGHSPCLFWAKYCIDETGIVNCPFNGMPTGERGRGTGGGISEPSGAGNADAVTTGFDFHASGMASHPE